MPTKNRKLVSVLLLILFFSTSIVGCAGSNSLNNNTLNTKKLAAASEFAPYNEVPVDAEGRLAPYTVAADLSNVENASRFIFSEDARTLLAQNGFVVIPNAASEFFMVYEFNRYDSIPNFVTTDAMLHNYHLFFNYLLRTVEEEHLRPELQTLTSTMLKASAEQLTALKGGPWENAAKRNLAFFTVGSCLLDPDTKIPSEVKEAVEAELQLIRDQRQLAISPVMSIGTDPDLLESLKEDYTQYIPRGHYTRSENLKSYFQAMMWYGRMTFRLKSEDETRSALLMTLALQQNENSSPWEKIYLTTDFFVGQSDDLGCLEYSQLINQVYGDEVNLPELATDNSQWQSFLQKASELKGPQINSIPIFDPSIQPDREQEIKGFRFMGQRYTVDADIFQRLVYREVGPNQQNDLRTLPKGLDIPAALGSQQASRILEEMSEFDYTNYPENMNRLQEYLADLRPAAWHQNLYWTWMHTLKSLIGETPSGYPSFMLNQAWEDKELNTFLASWTELKHDTILYAKQVYAEMGGGIDEEIDDRGYVEPNPHLYARLAALSAMTREGLKTLGLLNERDAESLEKMEVLALNLKTISEKELKGESLTDEEYELIRSFGGQLEHFWLEALRDQEAPGGRSQLLADNPAMIVADVATAPPDLVLEEGTGYIQSIYAVVPLDGKLRIAKGAVYSYYEFPWPASDRLTDNKWREMLDNNQAPPAPEWTNSFVSQGSCRIKHPWEEN
ncbi:MAG: DUF3160 domain-containing protein [Syntrophomonadaceae bacterium]|jgi:hypothetical protein